MKNQSIKIAYVHSMHFPSQEANAFDSVWAASALSKIVPTTFFIRDSKLSDAKLKKYYNIEGSSLKFKSLHLNLTPDRILIKIPSLYEKLLACLFRLYPGWSAFKGKKVLYIRDPKALLFWGMQKQNRNWLKSWTLIFEAHDPLGIDPNQFGSQNPFSLKEGAEGERRQAILKAAKHFDAVICNSQALADDIYNWTNGEIHTDAILIGSNVPRVRTAPEIKTFGSQIVLGYIGTIDRQRGVDMLLDALKILPGNVTLRLVGRLRKESGVDPAWLENYLQDPELSNRISLQVEDPIKDVAAEIDKCDILIQTASNDQQYARYGVPLKAFCYMNRGKPIIVGDVPCFHEFFQGGQNCIYYKLDPNSLAEAILTLVNNPGLAEKIARGALERSEEFDLSHRVEKILAVINANSKD